VNLEMLRPLFSPTVAVELGIFYLFWCLLYCVINIWWDIASDITEPFHLADFQKKIGVIFGATSLSSGLILILSVVQPAVANVVGDTSLPLILAGLSTLAYSIGTLCPYTPEQARAARAARAARG
jgi:hypothetical protein